MPISQFNLIIIAVGCIFALIIGVMIMKKGEKTEKKRLYHCECGEQRSSLNLMIQHYQESHGKIVSKSDAMKGFTLEDPEYFNRQIIAENEYYVQFKEEIAENDERIVSEFSRDEDTEPEHIIKIEDFVSKKPTELFQAGIKQIGNLKINDPYIEGDHVTADAEGNLIKIDVVKTMANTPENWKKVTEIMELLTK